MMSQKLLIAVAKRPWLWGEALRALLAVAPRNWWRRSPFLPLPDAEYTAWRLATTSGSIDSEIEGGELVSYLSWRRRQHAPLRRI